MKGTYNKRKYTFPLWTKIAIVFLFLVAILGIIWTLKVHYTYYSFEWERPPIGLITTIAITALIAIANLILVGYTRIYANQTKKMVDHYYQTRKEDLRPIFVPIPGAGIFSKKEKLWQFVFTNVGATALFVKILAEEGQFGKKYRNSEDVVLAFKQVSCGCFKIGDEPGRTVYIYSTDKNAIKYLQTMEYIVGWGFKWDDSCLPIELDTEPDWAKEMTSPIDYLAENA